MMERVVSLRNTVSREGSSGSSHSETVYEVRSNRFPGFPAAPRPRINGLSDRSDISLPSASIVRHSESHEADDAFLWESEDGLHHPVAVEQEEGGLRRRRACRCLRKFGEAIPRLWIL